MNEIGSIGTIIIIVVSILSWLVSYVNEKKKTQRRPQRTAPQQPPRVQQRRVPPQQQQLQNEIDLFLQKTGGRQQAAEPIIEIVPEDDFGNANRQRRLADESTHTFASHLEDRHIVEKDLGSGIRQHVNTHAGSNELDFLVEQDMDERVDDSVQSRLGSFSGYETQIESTRSKTAEQIFRLFQTPQGVRQAIVMQEILTRRKFS